MERRCDRGRRPGRWRRAAVLAALAVVLAAVGMAAREEPPAEQPPGTTETATVRLLLPRAAGATLSVQGDLLAFERENEEGYSQLWIARPDGGGERCLTCLPIEFRKRHAGGATWHPSGRLLVFVVSKPFPEGGRPQPFQAVPGRDLGSDLWYVTTDGSRFGPLTRRAELGGRVLSPRFSREGDQLLWSERVAARGGAWGGWVLRLARFAVGRTTPDLGRVTTHQPGDQHLFYEGYGFTPDDLAILLAGNLEAGQPESGMDLYLLRPRGGGLTRLTSSSGEWDRFAALSPDGRWIAWASSRGLAGGERPPGRDDTRVAVPLDVWLMNADGTAPRRLTHFNDPLAENYLGRVTIGSIAWAPRGDRLLVGVAPLAEPSAGSAYVVELDRPFAQ